MANPVNAFGALRLARVWLSAHRLGQRIKELLDFAASVRQAFLAGSGVQQRQILEAVGSNYTLRARKVSFQMEKPLALLAEASGFQLAPHRGRR